MAFATDWWAIVFNPSLPYRLTPPCCSPPASRSRFSSQVCSALRWLFGDRSDEVRTTLRFGLMMGALLIPVQILAGDLHGINTLEHQPAKVAAMEGNWETQVQCAPPALRGARRGDPLEQFRDRHPLRGEPHSQAQAGRVSCRASTTSSPRMARCCTRPWRPMFYAFRIMVGTGMAMLRLLFSPGSRSRSWRRRGAGTGGGAGSRPDAVSRACPAGSSFAVAAMSFSGWLATLAGWYVTEIGRQPWLVTGVMTTEMAVADVPSGMVLSTLVTYLAVLRRADAGLWSPCSCTSRAGPPPANRFPTPETPPLPGGHRARSGVTGTC